MTLPVALHRAAKHSEKIAFYCAYGHQQYYPQGDSEATILRRELDRAKQRLAHKDDQIKDALDQRDTAERRRAAAQGQVTRIKNRVSNGTCPCCNRSFQNLQRHMANKHPDFKILEGVRVGSEKADA